MPNLYGNCFQGLSGLAWIFPIAGMSWGVEQGIIFNIDRADGVCPWLAGGGKGGAVPFASGGGICVVLSYIRLLTLTLTNSTLSLPSPPL